MFCSQIIPKTKAIFLCLSIGFVGIAGCQKASDESDTEAITNRAQNFDRFIAIIKLESPALLTTAVKENGVTKVDQDLKATINAEQEAFEKELQALSSEIKVLYRYKMVLNGFAVVAPIKFKDQFKNMIGTSYVEGEQTFDRMETVETPVAQDQDSLATKNSSSFIGAHKVQTELGVKGQGMRVGILDTGIDYTHAMFGGTGTEEAFNENNPDEVEEGSFPTAKVAGGIDLVGTKYNSGAPDFELHVPKPDADPIDEGGHGSHVGGTVAGIGDGINTYSGVAPEATLYAIKVFGAEGSTGDAVIIAALEYSADPNKDDDPADQLDVINLSLGSSYGTPHILYSLAMKNLVIGGTTVVASGGNSGHKSYIVGAPGTTTEAISVAASIDNMRHNWAFDASLFTLADGTTRLVKAVEGGFTKPISESGNLSGKLVFIGLGNEELDPTLAAKLKGNIAFIDRGAVSFCTKAETAVKGGAIGMVVANNVDTDPISMGGDCEIDFPGIMITKSMGDTLKDSLENGDTTIAYSTEEKIEEPQLIDTLTGFSSRGPRSVDALIKPEVSAPGYNIISAKMGGGTKGTKMSGTSMAAPHVAGLAALVRQHRKDLSTDVIKSLIVNSTVSISDKEKEEYPVAMQGAGRVQTFEAATANLAVLPSTLSLGEVLVEKKKAIRKTITLRNLSDADMELTSEVKADEALTVDFPATVTLKAGESKDLKLTFTLAPTYTDDAAKEMDGFVTLKSADKTVARIPMLAVAKKAARIGSKALTIMATSEADAEGAIGTLEIANAGQTDGDAIPFNLIKKDDRKESTRINENRDRICDLESAGFRVVEKEVEGTKLKLLQFGVKLFNPVTTWHTCEISIQIDSNGDGVADQELLGGLVNNYAQVGAEDMFGSILTDGDKMRSIRAAFEANFPEQAEADYQPAIIDLQDSKIYNHSTLAIVSADISKLAVTAKGDLKVKIAVLGDVGSPAGDDFLGKESKWHTLGLGADTQTYVDLPEVITVEAGSTKTVDLTRGGGHGSLILYLPHNASNFSSVTNDRQSVIVKPKFKF
jgi:subtilisin family serine protease